MTIKTYCTYKDPIFNKPAKAVDDSVISNGLLLTIMQDLYDTHFQNPEKIGVGLAANQIGHPYRVFLANISEEAAKNRGAEPLDVSFWMNPTYKPIGSQTNLAPEGCFSVPGMFGREVKRFNTVKVDTQQIEFTKNKDNQLSISAIHLVSLEFNDFQARLFQHEIDHIDPERPKFYFEYMEGGIGALEPIENYNAALKKERS